ncbi:MAG: NERD domain-containing protein [Sphingomonas sp.]
MTRPPSLGTIYVGSGIEHAAERAFIAQVSNELNDREIPYVIFANISLGARQVDCIVATASSVTVIEVKSSRLPVKGGIDGSWGRLQPDGSWAGYGNGYQQALNAKNRLRDAMRARSEVGRYYPDAAVVFVGGLPSGSALTSGDFKVAVATDSAFDVQSSGFASPWPLDRWQAFAADLGLTRVSLGDAIAPPEVQASFVLIREYNLAVATEFGREGGRWLAESDDQCTTIFDAIADEAGCHLIGPTGCGKTMLAKRIASDRASLGECVLYLTAKDYNGSWSRLLKRELALVCDVPPAELLRAIGETDAPVRIILDGLNELGADCANALRGLRALVRKLGARLVVTGQGAQPTDLRALRLLAIAAPTLELKSRIAVRQNPGLSPSARVLLKAVCSGMEAAIVAEIGAALDRNVPRQLLIEQFIRQRLGRHARRSGIGLRRLASALHEAVSFSLAETRFDELMVLHGMSPEEIDAMFSARILVSRGGRVSFSHELILNACCAHAVAEDAQLRPEQYGHRLATPRFEAMAGDVISALEDASACGEILAQLCDAGLLHDAAAGHLGPIACDIASGLLDNVEREIRAEISTLTLTVIPGDRPTVDWHPETVRDWTDQQLARIAAVGLAVESEQGIDRYLSLCAAMDAHLVVERKRIAEEAKASGLLALRTHSFWLSYYGFGRQVGFMHLTRACANSTREEPDGGCHAPLDVATLTSGQLHFYIEKRHLFHGASGGNLFAEDLISILEGRFCYEPYHVKLAVLHAAGFARSADPTVQARLIEAVQQLDIEHSGLGISTAVVDAMKFLGALDDPAEENRAQIRWEFASAVGDEDNEVVRANALSTCVAMFDHPFDAIYYEEFEALSEESRRLVLRRALGAPDIRKCTSLGWVVRQVALFGDQQDANAMRRLAELPEPRNAFPQEEWGAFVIATRHLARLNLELPALTASASDGQCLEQIRALVYVAEIGARQSDASEIWQQLGSMPSQLVIGCLSEVEAALLEQHWSERDQPWPRLSLMASFRAECLQMARRFVDAGLGATYFHHAYARDAGPDFAFACVEQYGDRSDVERLRKLTSGHPFARAALRALQAIDSVS